VDAVDHKTRLEDKSVTDHWVKSGGGPPAPAAGSEPTREVTPISGS